MPSAVKAIFEADSGPMSAEFASMETTAKRFGNTLADVMAKDNARMIENSAALKALNAERMAARSEAERYAATLATGAKTIADLNRAENEQLLRNSAALKQLNAERLRARALSNAPMQGPDLSGEGFAGFTAERRSKETRGQIEQARRDIRARALRRGRLAARMQGPDLDGSMRLNEMMNPNMKGGHAGFGAGQMQIIHSMRATFDSLISGGSPLTIFFQQMPQIIQGLSMMKKGAMDFVKEMLSMPIGPVMGLSGAFLAVAAGAVAAYAQYKHLVDLLKGQDTAAFTPEYILKRNQAANHLLEVERLIALEVKKQADAYTSVEQKSQRINELTKQKFDHLRKMNDLTGGGAAGALEIDKQERQAEIDNLQRKKYDLEKEASDKKAQAQAMGLLPSEEKDANNIKQKEAQLALVEAAANDVIEGRNSGKTFTKRNAFRAYNKMTASDVSDDDILAAEKKTLEDRNSMRKQVKAAKETKDTNDILRTARKTLEDASGKSAGEANAIGLSLPNQIAKNKQADKNAADEFAMGPNTAKGYGLSSAQKMGAYAATPPEFKRLVDAAIQTAHNTAGLKPTGMQHSPSPQPPRFGMAVFAPRST